MTKLIKIAMAAAVVFVPIALMVIQDDWKYLLTLIPLSLFSWKIENILEGK